MRNSARRWAANISGAASIETGVLALFAVALVVVGANTAGRHIKAKFDVSMEKALGGLAGGKRCTGAETDPDDCKKD